MDAIERDRYWAIEARECEVTIERRPAYCDRGRFIVKVWPREPFALDAQDGWPRYYFDWDRMLAEVEAWLARRERLQTPDTRQERVA